ncbi:glycosyltransferase [Streptococcus uberis]|uniref:glycosyltransferase n=1 Tax=Streptococcus uberis TaxID=1349 RepID=UPI0019392CD0|nr:glycosyltransferase [Streptococcus uberis]
MIDIAFVILNFNIVDETIDCIESIEKNIDTKNYQIIVVDNGSKNEIIRKLKIKLSNHQNIEFIVNNENLGFARGNNIGIEKALQYSPKFIACINNDTLILQKNFFEVLNEKYEKYKPSLIGPKIILKDGSEQHRPAKPLTKEQYELLIKRYEIEKNNIKTLLITALKSNRIINYIYNSIFSKFRKGREKYFKETINVVLHGCFLIFTPQFFKKLKGFNESTFLYLEEEFLYFDVRINNLTTLYTPDLWIKHLEDVSTETIISSNTEKRNFVRLHQINSLKKLVNYMDENEKKIKDLR